MIKCSRVSRIIVRNKHLSFNFNQIHCCTQLAFATVFHDIIPPVLNIGNQFPGRNNPTNILQFPPKVRKVRS